MNYLKNSKTIKFHSKKGKDFEIEILERPNNNLEEDEKKKIIDEMARVTIEA